MKKIIKFRDCIGSLNENRSYMLPEANIAIKEIIKILKNSGCKIKQDDVEFNSTKKNPYIELDYEIFLSNEELQDEIEDLLKFSKYKIISTGRITIIEIDPELTLILSYGGGRKDNRITFSKEPTRDPILLEPQEFEGDLEEDFKGIIEMNGRKIKAIFQLSEVFYPKRSDETPYAYYETIRSDDGYTYRLTVVFEGNEVDGLSCGEFDEIEII